MIPMSDADVQEIRDLVADQKSRFEAKQKTLLAMKKVAEHPIQPNDPETLPWFQLLVAERNRRLGIPTPSTGIRGSAGIPGPSTGLNQTLLAQELLRADSPIGSSDTNAR